ncbi:MAG: hypothetical protein RJA07_1278 [Bacteroidota bacterium]|jgi:hypothetical protein
MPFPIKTKYSWLKDSPLEMASFARGTVSAMTSNSHVPTPPVTLANMSTAAQRVETAWANKDNGQVAQDELHNATDALNADLHLQADYVSKQAAGDTTVIHGCGFESTKATGTSNTPPEAPEATKLTSIAGGKLNSKVKAIANATKYTHIAQLGGDFQVTIQNGQLMVPANVLVFIIPYGSANETFENLPALQPVMVCVVAHNGVGSSGFSPQILGSTIN